MPTPIVENCKYDLGTRLTGEPKAVWTDEETLSYRRVSTEQRENTMLLTLIGGHCVVFLSPPTDLTFDIINDFEPLGMPRNYAVTFSSWQV